MAGISGTTQSLLLLMAVARFELLDSCIFRKHDGKGSREAGGVDAS
jgi:hypothetical protein